MYRTALVRQMVLHFAELAGWEGDTFLVTSSRRTFDAAAKRHRAPGVASGELGATLYNPALEHDLNPVTWIESGIRDFSLLANTCAHEALHAARPTLPHGPAYERAVRKLLRGIEP